MATLIEDHRFTRQLTEAERAALDVRDRALMERFVARDETVNRELVQRLDLLGRTVAERLWPRLYGMWRGFRGEYFDVLWRYREAGKLKVGVPLYFLAQRLLKQAGRKAGIWAHRDHLGLSFQTAGLITRRLREKLPADEDASRAAWLEKQARTAAAVQPRFRCPEAALGACEQLAWLEQAAPKLSPSERATYEAWLAVCKGEHESLAEALGVAVGTSYNRLSAMWASLGRIAEEEGATDILERIEQRKPTKKMAQS